MRVEMATFDDDEEIKKIAKLSKFTKDFCSLLYVRQDIENIYFKGFIGKAVHEGAIVGFIYARHLVRKPFTSVYYMASVKKGAGRKLVQWALKNSPHKKLQLVCEQRNEQASKFYDALGFTMVGGGVVGKNNRPYRRLELS